MEKEGRAPNDPSFAIGFWAARKLRDPDFAKMLLEMRSKAEYPPRQDFFVQASQGFPMPEAFSSSGTGHCYVRAPNTPPKRCFKRIQRYTTFILAIER